MVRTIHNFTLLIFIISSQLSFGQNHPFGFQEILKKSPHEITTFCVANNETTKLLLANEGIQVKYASKNWLFISTTPEWIDLKTSTRELKKFYFEFAPPIALSDTALVLHHVPPVHQGIGGLGKAYTGKNVIVGVVDQGIDWNHPDFIDENGNTRVLRYWDHSTNTGGTVPQPYNYGIVWDSSAINNGTCTSNENSTAHGSTVAGMASGNGFANGSNKGIAPNSNLIIVETNFNLPNWTLTIADACDYIFKVADTLGMPAVINLSLGSYLGSHDGNDPAAEYMETLLDEHEGRIVVCAAGNSGIQGKYHVQGNVDSDTSFVWFLNNPSTSAALGANHIYFDLWSDQADATFNFAFGADKQAPLYGFVGHSNFKPAQSSLNTTIYDTIYNANGNRIATIESYTELIGGNYHLEAYFSNVDSTDYNFRFMTTGSGKYDLWSGAWMGLNNIVSILPSPAVLPGIIHYHLPDSMQTIVSSWNCSEKVISVGNVRNRYGHIDNNGNQYTPADYNPVGKLSPSSSKGPNRHNVTKPDVSASGDVSLAAAPLWLLTNPANNSLIDSGGWHVRNGGTSMASPVVAGIAALYLEKCSKANYSNFKADLIATTFSDGFTGNLPNNAYGFGKPHALNLMLLNEFPAFISGEDSICFDPILLTANSNTALMTAIWSDGYEGINNPNGEAGDYTAQVFKTNGCSVVTDTFTIIQSSGLPILPIIQSGNTLATLSFTNYQWTLNGVDIPGAINSTLTISPPYGTYTCYCTNENGCVSETAPFTPFANISEINEDNFSIYPNPTNDIFTVQSNTEIIDIKAFTQIGKEVNLRRINNNSYSISELPSGIYHLVIERKNEKIHSKITRM